MTTPTGNPLVDDLSNAGYSDIISNYLGQWGLSSLVPTVQNLGATGASSDQINLTLQQTPEWQARFAGNAQRQASGLAPLDPASYIALEDGYTQATRAYNLPQGFVTKDMTDAWIGGDVSTSELSNRLQVANNVYLNADAGTKAAWNQFYGPGDAVAAILDPAKAESVIEQQGATAQIGGAAINQGLTANQAIAGQAAQQGVTLDSARKAYADVASRLPTDTQIASRFGQQFGQTEEEQATLLGDATQGRNQSALYAEEASQFKGHGGASDASNNPGDDY